MVRAVMRGARASGASSGGGTAAAARGIEWKRTLATNDRGE
jgi:hypothetical protein